MNMNSDKTKALLTAALNLGLIDARYLVELLANPAPSFEALSEHLDDIAAACQHDKGDVCRSWFRTRDALSFVAQDDPSESDKLGFRADARADAHVTLAAAGLTTAGEAPYRNGPDWS
jgi:hypothetical protein